MKRRIEESTVSSHELTADELANTTGGFLPFAAYGVYQAAAVAAPALSWAAMNPHAVVRAGVNGYQAASDAWDWAWGE